MEGVPANQIHFCFTICSSIPPVLLQYMVQLLCHSSNSCVDKQWGTLQVRRNAHVEIIPLSTGCLGACTYCKTRHARGALGSYELDAIASRACKAAADPLVRLVRLMMAGLRGTLASCQPAGALERSCW